MWCYALGVVAVVLRSWCVVLCTVCQLVSNWIQTYKQCTRLHTNSAGPQPQHLGHNTTCGSEQPIYKNSWRWTCKCPKHVEAIYENKIIVKLLHQVGTSPYSKVLCNFPRTFYFLYYPKIFKDTDTCFNGHLILTITAFICDDSSL